MSLFYSFFKLTFQDNFTYRLSFYLSLFSSFLILYIQVNVWQALYGDSSAISNITYNEMLVYLLAATTIYALTRSNAAKKIGSKIEDGSIIADMIKPVNFKIYILSEDFGDNGFRFVFSVVPVVLLSYFLFQVEIQANPIFIALFIVSALLAVMLAFYINYILALCVFWLESSWYISFLVNALFVLFSGSQIPIWFYPQWLAQITYYLPFRFIIFEPISIFMSKYAIMQSLGVIAIQLAWLAGLYVLERFVWLKVQHKVIIHGG